jgi:hypothetical protein
MTTPALALSAQSAAVCDRQWRRWRGPVSIWVQSNPHSVTAIQRFHRDHLASLLVRGIPIAAIRRLALDDPREPWLVLETRTQAYIDRIAKRRTNRDRADRV